MSALNIKQGASGHSAYDLRDPNIQLIEVHTLAVLVDNEAGFWLVSLGFFPGGVITLKA